MRFCKIDIAKHRLDTAANLYFTGGDRLVMTTLPGATEEPPLLGGS
jgi:hypothetical protein